MNYLTFTLGGEICALSIDAVESVLDTQQISTIPGTPPEVIGLLNLRGEAVPVVDVGMKLGAAPRQTTENNGIIVLNVESRGKKKKIGALVESVHEVVQLEDADVEPIDDLAISFDQSAIKGIGKRDGHFIIVMSAERLFESADTIAG